MGEDTLPTPDALRQYVDYDPEAGTLTRKAAPREIFASDKAFHAHKTHVGKAVSVQQMPNGYGMICVLGVRMYAHRAIFAIVTGAWPEADVDHRNGNRMDNRWANLRSATRSENHQNRRARPTTGAYWHKKSKRWQSQITIRGVTTWLGFFDRQEDAISAYEAAKAEVHQFQPHIRRA